MMRLFIEDDAPYDGTIVCMGVQLFTAPSISHHLIENQDALRVTASFVVEVMKRMEEEEEEDGTQ